MKISFTLNGRQLCLEADPSRRLIDFLREDLGPVSYTHLINEDLFLAEIIDPDTGEVLPYGEEGELVITTLKKEGCPVLRYRTRDITRLMAEPCPCGRTTIRMKKIRGRSDDMLIIKGVNVFPSQIEAVLSEVAGTCLLYTSPCVWPPTSCR